MDLPGKAMMIHWLVQCLNDDAALAAGRPPDGLLNGEEYRRLARYTNLKRRTDWLLGRWTAKRLLQAYMAGMAGATPALDALLVDNEESGAPYAGLECTRRRRSSPPQPVD